jgi:hypothetical protein
MYMSTLSESAIEGLVNVYLPRPKWRVSAAGNITRGSPTGWTLTVFQRADRWAWSMRRDGNVRYSPGNYLTQDAAARAAWEAAEATA